MRQFNMLLDRPKGTSIHYHLTPSTGDARIFPRGYPDLPGDGVRQKHRQLRLMTPTKELVGVFCCIYA